MIRRFRKQENRAEQSAGKKNEKRKLRFGRSLMSRYMLLILCAVLFVPVVLPITSVIYVVVVNNVSKSNAAPYGDVTHISNLWSNESKKLGQAAPAKIDDRMKQLHAKYPKSSVYRVDENGKTAFILGGEGVEVIETPVNGSTLTTLKWPLDDQKKVETRIPAVWDASYTLAFMKEAVYRDPLTVVSFIGGGNQDKGKGFMVIEVPRYLLQQSQSNWPMELLYLGLLMTIIFLLFIVMSILFFARIRKRLIRLQTAMVTPGKEGIPLPVDIRRSDEIGQLEDSFNQMVYQLTESRHREREEEQFRKRLIAGLSHDLRTPLTVIRGHMHALHKEALSDKGISSLSRMESKMDDLSGLIDNMLSYNLLASGKYTLKLEEKDVFRIVRETAAAWYPVWEKEQFDIDIDLPDEPLIWRVDEQGMRRILDNLFQNVVRYAGDGKYIGISTERIQDRTALVIRDQGPGMQQEVGTKGTGLGLSIVDLLVREMGLRKKVDSSPEGVRIFIY
ncbi:HAMP domain-containing sensor histidine kinase [Paenibacillus sp. 7516]|uniref:HAMP domain-containing sensor histidine kinase n=1 Tax=Paenibacillus sp. 7516 TaxID=2022549 RepID=UPI000BA76A5D|nr:HAMP domain-containing sensor histidine kinase [Paenibacillus sp. 7516]PAF29309.1 two-component sensor histidine kinase [Paenibacillus sp. 7516]